MLAIPSDNKLAADGDTGSYSRHKEVIGPKKQAEGEGGDQRAFGIKRGQVEILRGGVLSQLSCAERDDDLPERYIEVEEEQSIEKEG